MRFTVAFLILLLITAPTNSEGLGEKKLPRLASPGYVPGEVLVKYKAGFKAAAASHYQARWGITILRSFERIGVCRVKLPHGMTVEGALEMYRADQRVEYAEPNYYRFALLIPNDTDFPQQWGFHNTGQEINGTTGAHHADIHAPEAWNATPGGEAIVIAVIDSGVDVEHPDLSGSIAVNRREIPDNGIDDEGNGYIDDVSGWDFVDNDNSPDDPIGHGTHVAGTIAAKGNNAKGIAGLCWEANILPLRAFDRSGTGTVEHEIGAIEYALARGAKIINLSIGSYEFSQAEYDAVAEARFAGALVVAAAGNSGIDNDLVPLYPASYDCDNIISVAASNQQDFIADFSNYGASSVDVAAPGVNIFSCVSAATQFSDSEYGFKTGTSMATSFVSGVAGFIWSFDPTVTYQGVKEAILQSVDRVPSLKGKVLSGGRVNVYSALENLAPQPTTVIVPYVVDTADSEVFFSLNNPGSEGITLNVDLMADGGSRESLGAVIEILPQGTALLWASDLRELSSAVNDGTFAARLIFAPGTAHGVSLMCFMWQGDQVQAIPGYTADKANADLPVSLIIPELNASLLPPLSLRVNNWSESDAPVAVTLRAYDGEVVASNAASPLPATATGTYLIHEIVSELGIPDGSFSIEFTVYGEADKIFAVLCKQSASGILILPVYKNKTTTRLVF